VQELFRIERELKEARRAFDQNDDRVVGLKEAGKKGLEDLAESVVDGTTSTKGTGRKGKGKALTATTMTVTGKRGSDAATDGSAGKKRKVGNTGSVA
jgi:transcription initiation factor TFIID subunit 13